MILLKLIFLLCVVYLFMYRHFSFKYYCLHLYVSLHFREICTPLSSLLHKENLPFYTPYFIAPTFQIYGRSHANQILVFTVHPTVCSSAMDCYFMLQYEARDLFYVIFST